MISKALVAASTKPIILSILAGGENYGYQIIQRVKEISEGSLEWADNMLYPVLRRLEKDGFVSSCWKMSKEGRPRRYYRITPRGRTELETERRQWTDVQKALTVLWEIIPVLDR